MTKQFLIKEEAEDMVRKEYLTQEEAFLLKFLKGFNRSMLKEWNQYE